MNLKQFDKIVTDQLSRSELVLMGKGTEYAEEPKSTAWRISRKPRLCRI